MYISVEIFCCYVYHSELQMGHSELENGTSKSESIPKCNWGTPVRVAHLHFSRAGWQVGIDSDLRLRHSDMEKGDSCDSAQIYDRLCFSKHITPHDNILLSCCVYDCVAF